MTGRCSRYSTCKGLLFLETGPLLLELLLYQRMILRSNQFGTMNFNPGLYKTPFLWTTFVKTFAANKKNVLIGFEFK